MRYNPFTMLRRRNARAYSWMTAVFLVTLWLSVFTYGALAAGDLNIPPVEFTTLDGGSITLDDLSQRRWALAFVILPGCPACEEVIEWFAQGAQAFPQINLLLVTPAATPALASFVEEHAKGLQVLLDQDGILGAMLAVERAPTVFLTVGGMHIDQLDWPFTQQEFRQAVEESLHTEFEVPDTTELLGHPAPDFTALDLAGMEIALADLPRPLLVSFFNPDCPPCWEVLPALVEASTEVSVVILAFVGEEGLSDEHRARFEKSEVGDGQVLVLLLEDFQAFDAYKVAATPTTILIDGKGVIAWMKEGQIDEQSLRDALRAIAAEED